MNWISNYVRPKINSLFSRREVPENLWTKCPECGTMLFHRELADNLNVCTHCDHHMAITPRDRFAALFDGGVFVEVKVPEPVADPLGFRDQKTYPYRIKAAQTAIGEKDAMLVAEGEVGRTAIEQRHEPFTRADRHVVIAVRTDVLVLRQLAVEQHRPAFGAFGPQVLGHLAAREQRIDARADIIGDPDVHI